MKKELYLGPDISKHQGIVDIKRIRDNGCKRIGLRVGYGRNNIDEQFTRNALACVNLNMPVLLYWFSYGYTIDMAIKEAEYCITQANKYWKKCPIAYDFEYDSVSYARKNGVNVTKTLATDMAIAFLKRIKAAGHIPVLYTNRDYLKNYFDFTKIKASVPDTYLWFALYSNTLTADEQEKVDIWQYTSKAAVTGITGSVDMNRFYTNFETRTVTVPEENNKTNINILNFQKAANADGYKDQDGKTLVEDGKDGTKTQYVRKQIKLKATYSKGEYKVYSQGNLVKWWQTRCNEILGHNQTVDGLFGNTSRTETIALQKKLGLTPDGIAGYNSIQAVFYN